MRNPLSDTIVTIKPSGIRKFFDIVSEMEKRYGFIYVDKQDDGTGTLKRMKKDSFYWYQKVIRSNGETL